MDRLTVVAVVAMTLLGGCTPHNETKSNYPVIIEMDGTGKVYAYDPGAKKQLGPVFYEDKVGLELKKHANSRPYCPAILLRSVVDSSEEESGSKNYVRIDRLHSVDRASASDLLWISHLHPAAPPGLFCI